MTSVAIQWDGTHTPGRVEALGKKVTKKDPDIISLLFALAQSCGGRGGAGRLLPCPGPKRICFLWVRAQVAVDSNTSVLQFRDPDAPLALKPVSEICLR